MSNRITKFIENLAKGLNSPHSDYDGYRIFEDDLSDISKKELRAVLNSGVIWKVSEPIYSCVECGGENKIKTSPTNKNFIVCDSCGTALEVKNRSTEIYYTNMKKCADFLISGLEMDSVKEVLDEGKLIYLGELEHVTGQPDVYLARGLNWQDEDFDYRKIALDKTILLSLVTPINSNIKKLKPGRVFVISDYLQISEDRLDINRPRLFSKINILFSSAQSKGGQATSAKLRGEAYYYASERYKKLKGTKSDLKLSEDIADEIIENKIKHGLKDENLPETMRKSWFKEFKNKLSSAG